MTDSLDIYSAAYDEYDHPAVAGVRRAAYGAEEIGQTSWTTADEYRRFCRRLELAPGTHLLDLGCGSGGPAVFAARTTGCRVTGVDSDPRALATGRALARANGLAASVDFLHADVTAAPVPLPDRSVDAVICVDAIIVMPGRAAVLRECFRLLKPGGRLLYTDPTVVTGVVTNRDVALRSATHAVFEFTAPGVNERLLADAGFGAVDTEDTTDPAAAVARRWHDARASHRDALRPVEGDGPYDQFQEFLGACARLMGERRLSRPAFRATRPTA